MRSRPLMTLRLGTAPTQNVGNGPRGPRLTFPIVGGSFEGDRLRGKVLRGAATGCSSAPTGSSNSTCGSRWRRTTVRSFTVHVIEEIL